MAHHEVIDERTAGCEGVALISHEHDLRAAFAPSVGMVGYSLTHRSDELLGQLGGIDAYRERGSSFGIPLLHPWANRLSRRFYSVQGHRIELDPARTPVHLDPNGLPIHGVLAASPHWHEVARGADEDRATLTARLDYGSHDELLAPFPFPHELQVAVELSGSTLTVDTTLSSTADVRVPVSFGWHPYLTLPRVAREDWRVELPVRRRALLDERGIPTGATEAAAVPAAALGERSYDDLFPELEQPAVFSLEGGGRRIELELGEGYPVAQVYAPRGEDYVCFEPMTAPTDALSSGAGLRAVEPGQSLGARFRVRVLGGAHS